MSFLEYLSDDQIALIGCGLALVASFGLMSLTYTVRQAVQPQRGPKPAAAQRVIPAGNIAKDERRKAA